MALCLMGGLGTKQASTWVISMESMLASWPEDETPDSCLSSFVGSFRSDYLYVGDSGQVETWINSRGWSTGTVRVVPYKTDAGSFYRYLS